MMRPSSAKASQGIRALWAKFDFFLPNIQEISVTFTWWVKGAV